MTVNEQKSDLGLAIERWNQGRQAPLDVVIRLTDLGYDVAALKRFHFNHR